LQDRKVRYGYARGNDWGKFNNWGIQFINNDIPDKVIACGVPAKVIKKIDE